MAMIVHLFKMRSVLQQCSLLALSDMTGQDGSLEPIPLHRCVAHECHLVVIATQMLRHATLLRIDDLVFVIIAHPAYLADRGLV